MADFYLVPGVSRGASHVWMNLLWTATCLERPLVLHPQGDCLYVAVSTVTTKLDYSLVIIFQIQKYNMCYKPVEHVESWVI